MQVTLFHGTLANWTRLILILVVCLFGLALVELNQGYKTNHKDHEKVQKDDKAVAKENEDDFENGKIVYTSKNPVGMPKISVFFPVRMRVQCTFPMLMKIPDIYLT